MSKSLALLVDGDLEKRWLENVCKGAAVRKIGNGDAYPTHIIVKQTMSLVRILNNRYQHIAILLDREDRTTSASDFADEITKGLEAAGIGGQSFSVHIKDREAEDWILADPDTLSEHVGTAVDVSKLSGKAGLARLLKDAGMKYSEVAVGSELLKSVICSRACENSPSLSSLRDSFPMECWWLQR